MPWDPPELPVDPGEATDRILDGMQNRLRGWVPVEGAPEVALAEEIGRETAATSTLAVEALELAVAGVGETAFGFPAYLGVPATVQVQLTVGAIGDVVPAELTVIGINPTDVEVAFTLGTDYTADSLTPTVTMTATEVGDFGNGVPAGDLTVVTSTATVNAAAALSPSANGADPESLASYLDRLVDYLATLRPGGVRAEDLSALARSVPGVHRCLAVDLYNPADPNTPAERTVTVFPIDETGAPVAAPVAAQVAATLEAAREVNFIIHVEEPTYTPIDIAYTAVAETGADPAAVQAAVDAAITAWLAAWGTTPEDTAWVPTGTVRYLELARVAGSVEGVAYLSSLTIEGAAADFPLAGVAALPAPVVDPDPLDANDPTTIAGTVS